MRDAEPFPRRPQIFLKSFTLTFLAEWGDRSQIATIGCEPLPALLYSVARLLLPMQPACMAVGLASLWLTWPAGGPVCVRLPQLWVHGPGLHAC